MWAKIKPMMARGEKNGNWRGGRSSEYNKVRASLEWAQWRKKVFERDNYTCVLCRIQKGMLHPHHVVPWRISHGLVFEVSNGITLCDSCHMMTHQKERNSQQPALFVVPMRS